MYAQTLAYIRTASGTVKVDAGQPVPEDALDEHLVKLVSQGVVGQEPPVDEEEGSTEEPAPAPAVPRPPAGGKRGASS